MARNFVQSASEHINDFPLVSTSDLGTVYTIAARCKPALKNDTFQTVFAQGSTTAANITLFQLSISSSIVSQIDKWRFLHIDDAVVVSDLFSTADVTLNVWQSVIGTRNVNDYELFVSAISVDTNTVTLGTTTTDEFVVGGRVNNSTTRQSFFDGDIADIAIWTVVLTADEIKAYEAGVSPTLIRPGKLLRYMPLWGTAEEGELTGTGGKGVLVNTPAVSTTGPPAGKYAQSQPIIPSLEELLPYTRPPNPSVDFNLNPSGYTPPTFPDVNFNFLVGFPEGALGLEWETKVHPTGQLGMEWRTFVSKEGSLGMEWQVLVTAEGKVGFEWETILLPTGQLGMEWETGILPDGQLGMEWETIILPTGKLGMEWQTKVFRTGELGLEWETIRSPKPQVELDTPYALRVGVQWDQVYGTEVEQRFDLPYAFSMSVEFDQPYDIRFPVAFDFDELWDLDVLDEVVQEFDQPWTNTVGAQFDQPWALTNIIAQESVQPIVHTVTVLQDFDHLWELLVGDPVRFDFSQPYPILTTTILNVTGNPTITLDGELIEIESADISSDEGTYVWQAGIKILNIDQFTKFTVNKPFSLNLYGEVYELIVTSRELRRDDEDVSMQLSGESPTILFDFPRAAPFTRTWDVPVFARAAAEEAIGETIDWQVLDWEIPGNRLGIAEGPPIRVVEQIAEAIGGLVETKPDGTLLVRPEFPVSTNDFASTTPDHTLIDTVDNFSVSERFAPSKAFDKFKISDQLSGVRDSMVFDFDDIVDSDGNITKSTTTGILKVFPSPFRLTVSVRHTQDGSIGIQRIGEQTDELTDLLEIKEGVGNTSRPIDSVTTLIWEADDLGGITFVTGEKQFKTTNVVLKYSLLSITYRTRFISYKISGIPNKRVQFILEDDIDSAVDVAGVPSIETTGFESGTLISALIPGDALEKIGNRLNVKVDGSTITIVDDKLTIPGGSFSATDKLALEMEMAFKTAKTQYTSELLYTGNSLTTVNLFETPSKTVKIFQKDLTYASGRLTTTVLTRISDSLTLTKTLSYTGSKLTNIDRVIA